jgi:hypothetical protein
LLGTKYGLALWRRSLNLIAAISELRNCTRVAALESRLADAERAGQYTLLAGAMDARGVLQPDKHDENYGSCVINLSSDSRIR